MENLRKMYISDGRLMYGKIRGVFLNDFLGFFTEEKLGNNSIVYDEENNGFIIDIRQYTPLQMIYERECSDNETLSSLFEGPLFLEMDELNKDDNALVKQVILALCQRCEEHKEQGLKRL